MADPSVAATFRKPFPEQVAAWRLRLQELRPSFAWDQFEPQSHARAFMVAGATKADLLADLAGVVGRAIEEGATLDEFRRDFREITDRLGWPGKAGEGSPRGFAWRTKVIYRTNMRTSYMTGRRAQLVDGGFPLWVYRHSGAAEPRLQHLAWDGVALPPDHEFWQTHFPPNGWGCGCTVRGARTPEGVRRAGGDPDKALPDGWAETDPRTGAPPGIDKGWGYSVGAGVEADILSSLGRKLPTLPAPIGAALASTVVPARRELLADQFSAFVDEVMPGPNRGRHMVIGALKPEWVAAARGAGVEPATAEVAVRDRDVRHTFRPDKVTPIDLDWYRRLPEHIGQPRLVLLEPDQNGEPAFLLYFDVPGETYKLVVEVNTPMKKAERRRINVLQSARVATQGDILAALGRGAIVVDGEV